SGAGARRGWPAAGPRPEAARPQAPGPRAPALGFAPTGGPGARKTRPSAAPPHGGTGSDGRPWVVDAGPVRLIGSDGHGIELRAVGYQFPDHPDPVARRSWLMIEGVAYAPEGSWSFRWAALTPDDAVLVSEWLLMTAFGEMPVADPHELGAECDGCLHFAEPN